MQFQIPGKKVVEKEKTNYKVFCFKSKCNKPRTRKTWETRVNKQKRIAKCKAEVPKLNFQVYSRNPKKTTTKKYNPDNNFTKSVILEIIYPTR